MADNQNSKDSVSTVVDQAQHNLFHSTKVGNSCGLVANLLYIVNSPFLCETIFFY